MVDVVLNNWLSDRIEYLKEEISDKESEEKINSIIEDINSVEEFLGQDKTTYNSIMIELETETKG